MRAIRRFTVRSRLPDELAPLARLVLNLRWAWHPQVRELFERVDPELWTACEGDPVRLLGSVGVQRLDELAHDADFLAAVAGATRGARRVPHRAVVPVSRRPEADRSPTSRPSSASPRRCRSTRAASASSPATTSRWPPTSACRSSPRACSTAAGYFRQAISRDGWQQESYPVLDPDGLPAARPAQPGWHRRPGHSRLPGGRALFARIWKVASAA